MFNWFKKLFTKKVEPYTYVPYEPILQTPNIDLNQLIQGIKNQWTGLDKIECLTAYQHDKWVLIDMYNLTNHERYRFIFRKHKKALSLRVFTNNHCWFNKKSRTLSYFGLIRCL